MLFLLRILAVFHLNVIFVLVHNISIFSLEVSP